MYKLLCVGGTFDRLHAGHEALLSTAFDAGEHVLIGLTTTAYVKAHKRTIDRTFAERKVGLLRWLETHDLYTGRFAVVPLNDAFGPVTRDPAVEALVVSEETYKRGVEANRIRKKAGLPPVDLLTVPMVRAQDREPISSSRIREGIITAWGKLVLPDALRDELACPLGRIRAGSQIRASFDEHRDDIIISVGDLTTKTIVDAGISPRLMIVDHRVGRRPYAEFLPLITKHGFARRTVASGPGFISDEAADLIARELGAHKSKKPTVIEVDGEEDLLTLIAIREAPLGSIVYYGQPPVPAWACGPVTSGVVEVLVTYEKQKEAIDLLKQFVHNT